MSIIAHVIDSEGEPVETGDEPEGAQFWLSRGLTPEEEKEFEAKFPKHADYSCDKDALELEDGKLGDMAFVNADIDVLNEVREFLTGLPEEAPGVKARTAGQAYEEENNKILALCGEITKAAEKHQTRQLERHRDWSFFGDAVAARELLEQALQRLEKTNG